MTSFRNLLQQKSSVYDRVHLLSQKINAIPLTKPSQTVKRYEIMDTVCDELQSQLQQLNAFIDEKLIDIKHITNKISKQIKKDHGLIDGMVKEEIASSNERMMILIEQQHGARKQADFRIIGYIDEQSNFIREAIEHEAIKREEEGRCIRESLQADICQITRVLDEATAECTGRLSKAENDLVGRTETIATNLRQICTSYSDNESQFYKMLRDLVKKVKQQMEEHKHQRDQTEAEILNLIEKMCDRAITQRNL